MSFVHEGVASCLKERLVSTGPPRMLKALLNNSAGPEVECNVSIA